MNIESSVIISDILVSKPDGFQEIDSKGKVKNMFRVNLNVCSNASKNGLYFVNICKMRMKIFRTTDNYSIEVKLPSDFCMFTTFFFFLFYSNSHPILMFL